MFHFVFIAVYLTAQVKTLAEADKLRVREDLVFFPFSLPTNTCQRRQAHRRIPDMLVIYL